MITPPIIKQKVQYGSMSYKIAHYARFRSRQGDGTFSAVEYKQFRVNSVKPSDIERAINRLVRNGHLREIGKGRFKFVDTNVLAELDFAYKETLWNKNKNSRRLDNIYKAELNDIQSDDL